MVDVVVTGVVRSKMLKWIPGQRIAAMVIDRLDCGACEEPHALPGAHSSYLERDTRPKNVEKEALEPMVVQGAEGIWDVETMMTGVEGG